VAIAAIFAGMRKYVSTSSKLKRVVVKISVYLIVILFLAACKKQNSDCPDTPRKVQFSLFTDTDFRNYADKVTFTLAIRNSRSQTVWDSVLPPMRVMDIPGRVNRLFFEKQLTGYGDSLLQVGFIYQVENVGISWYWKRSLPCEKITLVEFDFK
jgi:hypothetical protein